MFQLSQMVQDVVFGLGFKRCGLPACLQGVGSTKLISLWTTPKPRGLNMEHYCVPENHQSIHMYAAYDFQAFFQVWSNIC